MTAQPSTQQASTPDASAAGVGASGRLSEAALAGLVARIGSGDREALGQLYHQTHPVVTRYLTRRMDVCRDDVEDVVQETFLRAAGMADDFQPATTEVGAWLCGRVARWTLVDHFRKQRYVQHCAVDAAMDTARRAPFEAGREWESRPLSTRVVTALARLTPAQRRAVQLRYLDGHCNETAALIADTSPKALAQNALAARKRLRNELDDLAQQPVSWVATIPKTMAVRAALAETSNDVPAALAWLRERGVTVDGSYVYQVRKGARPPRQNVKDPAVREALTELGACDAATVRARLAERGIEVSRSYINRVRADAGVARPTSKNVVVREALAELNTTDANVVRAHLRARGIEVSRSYINQVRRTPAPATPAPAADPANLADELAGRVDTSASTNGAGSAVARAREAVARIPAARSSSAADEAPGGEPTRIDVWRGRDLSRDQVGGEHTSADARRDDMPDQLEVSA